MLFFNSPMPAPNPRRVRMFAAEKGVALPMRHVSIVDREQRSPEYLAINPKSKVPVLVIDGEPLTENVAIQVWIARNFPAAKLLPTDPMKEIKAISLMAWCASGIHPALTPNANPKRYCDLPGTEENVKACAKKLDRAANAKAHRSTASAPARPEVERQWRWALDARIARRGLTP